MKFDSSGYVNAALLFLEQNKDLFPDSYARAQEDYATFKKSDDKLGSLKIDLAGAMKGYVTEIGILARNSSW
jgi:hypothetical protein